MDMAPSGILSQGEGVFLFCGTNSWVQFACIPSVTSNLIPISAWSTRYVGHCSQLQAILDCGNGDDFRHGSSKTVNNAEESSFENHLIVGFVFIKLLYLPSYILLV